VTSPSFARPARRTRLAIGIAAVVSVAASAAHGAFASGQGPPAKSPKAPIPISTRKSTHHPDATPHIVTTCADDGSPGTLRSVIADPMTFSGDVVDLSQLTCGRITLGSEIRIHQDDLTLIGPDPYMGYVGIGAHGQHEVIQHFGYGTLQISGVWIVEGYFASDTDPTGGCIWSRGSVSLIDSRVMRCQAQAHSAAAEARGGAVYARHDLSLTRSTISDSHAYAAVTGGGARGGGAYVGGLLTSEDSTFARNSVRGFNGNFGRGGGFFVHSGATIKTTTVTGNLADRAAGAMLYNPMAAGMATITSSSISGNVALKDIGGLYSRIPLKIDNTTIAFNRSRGPSAWADGLYVGAALELDSSIVADNAGKAGLSDIGAFPGVMITGSNNLVVQAKAGTMLPPNTLGDCPKLDPLIDIGGLTLTHGLRLGSPAIDNGDDGMQTTDQRGLPRVVGATADIGSVERQNGDVDERILSTSFEGPCDI
jgi:hypothetical protein